MRSSPLRSPILILAGIAYLFCITRPMGCGSAETKQARGTSADRIPERPTACLDELKETGAMERIPLLEFDSDRSAVFNPPPHLQNINPPEHCVMPIHTSLIERLREAGHLEQICQLTQGPPQVLVYILGHAGKQVAVVNPGLESAYMTLPNPGLATAVISWQAMMRARGSRSGAHVARGTAGGRITGRAALIGYAVGSE